MCIVFALRNYSLCLSLFWVGKQVFSVAAPSAWNRLQIVLGLGELVSAFKAILNDFKASVGAMSDFYWYYFPLIDDFMTQTAAVFVFFFFLHLSYIFTQQLLPVMVVKEVFNLSDPVFVFKEVWWKNIDPDSWPQILVAYSQQTHFQHSGRDISEELWCGCRGVLQVLSRAVTGCLITEWSGD